MIWSALIITHKTILVTQSLATIRFVKKIKLACSCSWRRVSVVKLHKLEQRPTQNEADFFDLLKGKGNLYKTGV